MKLLAPVVSLVLLAATPAFGDVLVDFEGPTSFASIADYYNGGTDSEGASGPNLGVSFGLDDLGLENDILGPYFSNAPSPLGVMAPVGPDTAMNVARGFSEFSFFYSASDEVVSGVQVWSGLNGQGTLLASFTLAKNAEADGPDRFSQWDQISSGALGEVARSVTFANAVGFAGFDNITVKMVPEPASAGLIACGLAGVFGLRCRRTIDTSLTA